MIYRIFLVSVCWILSQPVLGTVTVSNSIKPLQLIAQAVAGEHATVTVLADNAQSAHQFSLTPSDRINLENSEIILWIGPQFEIQLAEFITRYQDRKTLITVTGLPQITLHELSNSVIDPHIWLNLDNAAIIATSLVSELIETDPGNESYYLANLARFTGEIEQLRNLITRDFEFVPDQEVAAFAVYHNAFQYFEETVGIEHSLALVRDPEREPSIRELLAIREQLSAMNIGCLFAEPDANAALIDSVLNGAEVRVVTLDLLGQQLQDGGYIELISHLSEEMRNCLHPGG